MTTNEVVVGLDDSPSARAALHWAARYARSGQLRLVAVHVLFDPYYPVVSAGFAATDYADDPSRRLREESARATFASVGPEPDWELELAEGPVGDALVRRSRSAALLVVGTREDTGLGRLVNGSVSHHCLTHADCPVVAVPATPAGTRRKRHGASPSLAPG